MIRAYFIFLFFFFFHFIALYELMLCKHSNDIDTDFFLYLFQLAVVSWRLQFVKRRNKMCNLIIMLRYVHVVRHIDAVVAAAAAAAATTVTAVQFICQTSNSANKHFN